MKLKKFNEEVYFSDAYLSAYQDYCAEKNQAELNAMSNVDTRNVYVLPPDH